MTEIKLTLEGECNPKWLADNIRARAKYMRTEVGATHTADSLAAIADSIEEQVKPAIQEPELSFSVINARPSYTDTVTTLTKLGDHWVDLDGNDVGPFDTLSAVEVLRIGVGAGYNHPLQQLRDILFRSPSGEMTNREGAEAYKALRREIGILLSKSPEGEPLPHDAASLGTASVRAHQESRGARFCTLTPNCRMADGHADGCRP